MRRTTMVATVFLLAAPALVLGGTYQWRDDAGTVHFTDDSDRIPDKYLKRAKEVDGTPAAKPAANAPKQEASPTASTVKGGAIVPVDQKSVQRERLGAELAQLRGGLQGKKQELQRLHHRWMVLKGRTPSVEEAKKFQKELAEGKTTDANNPYVSKNRVFSTAGAARVAYAKKLAEVREDEARVQQLERELEALK
ncbi:DUF4124 domain-containing protein [Geomonas paludis]|uniref:DUF4124 domain-containing protein n=1 Tax=Geomonas paludis TaxID=2740185 RepID=A0A6V8MWS5_9BACT|nr:DUF4124 domain-containing protein [Geomonas paludis]UPU35003.1 DUF4124 domain-containing protein [Geomonas paludis]GFO64540.1 hypothetical protein GMPD_24590 [Geomonas paludis]